MSVSEDNWTDEIGTSASATAVTEMPEIEFTGPVKTQKLQPVEISDVAAKDQAAGETGRGAQAKTGKRNKPRRRHRRQKISEKPVVAETVSRLDVPAPVQRDVKPKTTPSTDVAIPGKTTQSREEQNKPSLTSKLLRPLAWLARRDATKRREEMLNNLCGELRRSPTFWLAMIVAFSVAVTKITTWQFTLAMSGVDILVYVFVAAITVLPQRPLHVRGLAAFISLFDSFDETVKRQISRLSA